jgi:hypothetical protein
MKNLNKRSQEAETIIAQAYYIFKELEARGISTKDKEELIVKYFFSEDTASSWGFESTKDIVVAVRSYVENSKYLDSYSGAIYKSFETFLLNKE